MFGKTKLPEKTDNAEIDIILEAWPGIRSHKIPPEADKIPSTRK
jgi:hypothetical protein